ncbi:S-layer homology domain-containing protein [Paenibacillus sp. 2TAB23]|uniref:S-layer homology domain-containing protein n=1 Tax=Paenibacillus sp. 2TAB23 TaxID=3233004 RepID=UPI003F986C8E
MKRAIKSQRWIALLLAAVLALPVFGASSAVAAPESAGSSAKLDYFGSRYEALAGKDHVFETLTYYELDYLLRNATDGTAPAPDDNYILLFGGSWQPETQAAIGYINDVAKEYGVTSIKNFDTKLDGPEGWLDITKTNPVVTYEVSEGGTLAEPTKAATTAQLNKDFTRRYVDLGARYLTNLNDVTAGNSGKVAFDYTESVSPGTVEVNVVDSPFLFIYNKNNKDDQGKPTPIIASLEGISSAGSLTALQNGSGAESYKTALRGVFDKISPAGTKNAKYKVLTNQGYISGSYNEFRSPATGGQETPVIFTNEDPKIVLDSVTLDELKYTLSSEGTYVLLVGCAWCGDTQGIVKYVNQVANEYGVEKVYNFDAKLDGGVGGVLSYATNPRPTWDLGGGSFLHTRDNSQLITPIYTNLVNEFLPNISSEDTKKTPISNNIYYFKNAEAKANNTPTIAKRVQAPYVLVYNKDNKDANGNPAPILGHVELMGYWRATHSNAAAKSLKVNSLRTLFSRTELKPSGLTAVPPTAEGGKDAKVEGIANVTTIGGNQVIATKSLEYRLKVANGVQPKDYIPVPYKATQETSINGLTPGVYEFRYAAKPGFDSENPSYTSAVETLYAPGPVVEIVVPDFQAPPADLANLAPESASGQGKIVRIVDGKEVALPAGLEYKLKGDPDSSYEPVTGDAINVEPGHEYVVRVAAKTENGTAYAPSAFVTVYARGYKELGPPSALNAVHPSTLANDDGQIEGLTAGLEYKSEYTLEYKKGNGTDEVYVTVPETAISAGKLTGLTPDLYTVRYATYEDYSASPAVELRIKANVAAPQGLAGVAPTSTLQNSGKITGANADLEYRSSNQSSYLPVTGTEIAGLLTGSYEVRYKETASTLPSATVTVIVPEYVAPPTGGSGTGGGGATTPSNITQSGNTVVATIASKVDEASGTAVAVVPAATVTGLLDKAKQAEGEGKKAVLEIKVEDSQQQNDIQVTIPRSAFNGLVSGANAELKVTVGIGSISFDASTLKLISANSDSGDISFIISKSELAEENKEVLGDRPVYDLNVFAGQTIVTAFGGSKVFVSLPYTLKAGEDPNAVIVYYVTDEGELQVIRGQYNKTNAAVEYATEHFSQYIIGYNKIDFSDVSASAWFAPAINFLAARDITSGTDDTHFSPKATVTRGQFIVLLLKAYGIEPEAEGASNFTDAGNTYYTGYLAAAKRLSIANGFEGNRFAPEQTISRQELFTLLYRALSELGELPAAQAGSTPVSSFTDAEKVPSYADEAFKALVEAGIISGTNGKLLPGNESSRAEVAQVLYNLLSR